MMKNFKLILVLVFQTIYLSAFAQNEASDAYNADTQEAITDNKEQNYKKTSSSHEAGVFASAKKVESRERARTETKQVVEENTNSDKLKKESRSHNKIYKEKNKKKSAYLNWHMKLGIILTIVGLLLAVLLTGSGSTIGIITMVAGVTLILLGLLQ